MQITRENSSQSNPTMNSVYYSIKPRRSLIKLILFLKTCITNDLDTIYNMYTGIYLFLTTFTYTFSCIQHEMYIFYDKSTFTIKENLTINIKIFNTNIFMANEIKSTIISEEYVPVSEDFPLINC